LHFTSIVEEFDKADKGDGGLMIVVIVIENARKFGNDLTRLIIGEHRFAPALRCQIRGHRGSL